MANLHFFCYGCMSGEMLEKKVDTNTQSPVYSTCPKCGAIISHDFRWDIFEPGKIIEYRFFLADCLQNRRLSKSR